MKIIDAETIRGTANWPLVIEALRHGHRGKPAQIEDALLTSGERRMLVRSAWAQGSGIGVKAVTIFPDNPSKSPPLPSVQGPIILFDEEAGSVLAIVDGTEITKWKTAGDSALGADLLARADIQTLLMVGAGAMAEPLIRAHLSVRPSLENIVIWNRSPDRAAALAGRLEDTGRRVSIAGDLAAALPQADLISSATMSTAPLIEGGRLKPGCHLDLVGAFTGQMREADDEAIARGRIFVDSRHTAIDDIGELAIPIAAGVIGRDAVLGDL